MSDRIKSTLVKSKNFLSSKIKSIDIRHLKVVTVTNRGYL